MSTRRDSNGGASATDLRQQLDIVVSEVFGIDPADVHDDLEYGSIAGWDSVGHIDLLYALEQAFGIEVTAEAIARLTSVRAIEAKLLEQPPASGTSG